MYVYSVSLLGKICLRHSQSNWMLSLRTSNTWICCDAIGRRRRRWYSGAALPALITAHCLRMLAGVAIVTGTWSEIQTVGCCKFCLREDLATEVPIHLKFDKSDKFRSGNCQCIFSIHVLWLLETYVWCKGWKISWSIFKFLSLYDTKTPNKLFHHE